jgi:tetratricopeptide (TPR) repeat protein
MGAGFRRGIAVSADRDRSASGTARPIRLLAWILFLAGPPLVEAAVVVAEPRPVPCACELTADDAAGRTLLQAPAYALDRPGLLLASLTALGRHGLQWERLRASPDPQLNGGAPSSASYNVTEILDADPSQDRVLLRAPGLEACRGREEMPGASPTTTEDGRPAPATAPGEALLGLRARDGYRPRIFHAIFERFVDAGPGRRLMLIRIPDGGGAGAGIILDPRDRLIGSILPPQPGSDPSVALAVPVASDRIAEAAARPGLPPREALGQAADDFPETPVGLFARALLMTRPDQADEAIALMDRVARMVGEFEGLLMERGARRYMAGRNEAAIADFSSAARANPGLHLAYYDLGVALGTAGRYGEAVEALRRAVQIDPRHARSRYQLVLALRASGQVDLARRECELLGLTDGALAGELRALLSFSDEPKPAPTSLLIHPE